MNAGIARERRAFARRTQTSAAARPAGLIVGNRHFAAALAVHDRDRRAPIALARDEPIAKAEVDRLSCRARALRGARRSRRARARCDMPVKSSLAISRRRRRTARRAIGRLRAVRRRRSRRSIGRPCLLRKLEIALVVRGHAHHRAGAVLGEHVVRQPDRHAFARERVDRVRAGEDALFSMSCVRSSSDFDVSGCARMPSIARACARDCAARICATTGCSGATAKKRHAEERIDARREDVDASRRRLRCRTTNVRAFAAADPVALHRARCVPASRRAGRCPASSRSAYVGDLAETTARGCGARPDARSASSARPSTCSLASTVLIVRAPVHRRLALVREPVLVHAQEEPLIPAVVLRVAGGELARPIVTRAHQLDLTAHVGDVRARPRVRARCRAGSRRSRPAGRRRPSPSGARRCSRACASCARSRRRACSSSRGRRADRPTDTAASRARSTSRGSDLVVGAIEPLAFPALLPLAFDGSEIVAGSFGHEEHRTRWAAAGATPSSAGDVRSAEVLRVHGGIRLRLAVPDAPGRSALRATSPTSMPRPRISGSHVAQAARNEADRNAVDCCSNRCPILRSTRKDPVR